MRIEKNRCRKIALYTSSIVVGMSTGLMLAVTCTQPQINNQNISIVNADSKAENTDVVIALDKFASYKYNNAFRNKYSSSFALGVNTLTASTDWTNGQLFYSSSDASIKFKAWYQNDSRRTISNTEAVVADPFAVMQSGNMDISQNMIALKTNDLLNGSIQFREALTSMKNVGNAITWNGITDWDAAGNQSTTDKYQSDTMDKVICQAYIQENTSVSAAINIGSNNSGTVPSELRFNSSGGLTDDSDKISSCPELSHLVDNSNNYAGITFVNSTINGTTAGSQTVAAYSGDTTFGNDPIEFTDINVENADKENITPSEWLKSNTSLFDNKITINMNNGYPGVLSNAVSIVPNDATGEIKAVFKPQKILKSGCVANYTDRSYEKTLISGFKSVHPDVQLSQSSDSSDLWMWVGIGVGSAVVVAAAITTVILVLKKKKTSKKNLKVNSVSSNNKRLALSNGTPPKAPGQRPVPPRPGAVPQRPIPPNGAKAGPKAPPSTARPMPPRK